MNLRFGFFGDSIMAHYENYAAGIFDGDNLAAVGSQVTVEARRKRGWVNNLYLRLQVAWPAINFAFDNFAVPGTTSRTLLPIIRDTIANADYDCLVYACGVNDVWCQFGWPENAVDLVEYRENYTESLKLLSQHARAVICVGNTPFALPQAEEMNALLVCYNETARALAENAKVIFADPYPAFLDFTRLSKISPWSDGVHLNELGDTLVSRAIEAAISAESLIPRLAR